MMEEARDSGEVLVCHFLSLLRWVVFLISLKNLELIIYQIIIFIKF